jgi:hypothetical protein
VCERGKKGEEEASVCSVEDQSLALVAVCVVATFLAMMPYLKVPKL